MNAEARREKQKFYMGSVHILREEKVSENPFIVIKQLCEKIKTGWQSVFIAAVLGMAFVWGLNYLKLDYRRLLTGSTELFQILKAMFPPSTVGWSHVLVGAVETFNIAWMGTLIASVIAFFLSFLGAVNTSPSPLVRLAIRWFAALMRAIPAMVWALVFVAALGLGPLPGILALAVHGTGMLIKVFCDSIEEVDSGIIEALQATGASWFQVVARGILPAVWPYLLSWILLRLDVDLRYSSVMGMVGAGGIGWLLTRAMRMYQFNEAIFIILVIFAMLTSVERINHYIKKKVLNL